MPYGNPAGYGPSSAPGAFEMPQYAAEQMPAHRDLGGGMPSGIPQASQEAIMVERKQLAARKFQELQAERDVDEHRKSLASIMDSDLTDAEKRTAAEALVPGGFAAAQRSQMDQPPMGAAQAPTPTPITSRSGGRRRPALGSAAAIGGRSRRRTAATEKRMGELGGDIDAAGEQRRESARDQFALAEQQAEERARQSYVQDREVEKRDALDAQREVDRATRIEEVSTELENVREEAKLGYYDERDATTGKIETNWGRKSMAILAVALGGLAKIHNPNAKNTGLQAVNAEIERDLRGKRAAIGDQKTELGELRQRFGDDRSAEHAYRVKMLEKHKAQAETLMAQYQAPEMQARLKEHMADIDGQQAKEQADLVQRQAAMSRAGEATELQAAGLSLQERKAAAAGSGGGYELEGYKQTGKTTTTRKAFNDAQGAMRGGFSGISAAERAVALRGEWGHEKWNRDVVAEGETLQLELAAAIGQLNAAGVMSQEEVKLYKGIVGDITGVGFQMAKLETLVPMFRRKMDAAARAAGFEPSGAVAMERFGGREARD